MHVVVERPLWTTEKRGRLLFYSCDHNGMVCVPTLSLLSSGSMAFAAGIVTTSIIPSSSSLFHTHTAFPQLSSFNLSWRARTYSPPRMELEHNNNNKQQGVVPLTLPLQKGIAEFYDESSGIWEDIWGDHMHHGFYDPDSNVSVSDHRASQIRMIEEALRFASLSSSRIFSFSSLRFCHVMLLQYKYHVCLV